MVTLRLPGWCGGKYRAGRVGHVPWPLPGIGWESSCAWLVVILALLGGSPGFADEFIVLSDLHDNGSSQDQPARFKPGQDADETLIDSALLNARSNCAGRPRFVLCLGDILAHYDKRSATFSPARVQGDVAGLFKKVFPGVPVFTVLGNNDTDTADGARSDSDYLPQPPAFLGSFAGSWSALITSPADQTNFLDTFAAHGWYAATLPGLPNVRLLGLDSTYFENPRLLAHGGRDITGILPALQCLASNQFVWLSNQVSQARSDGVTLWLAFHIPPGLDPYHNAGPLWDPAWETPVLRLIAAHRDTMGAIFCGHTHADEFRLIYAGRQPVAFVHIAPSISPIHGNNPAYQIFTADAQSGRLLDCRTYHLAGPASDWSEEYSFTNQYAAPDYGLDSLVTLETNLDSNAACWTLYSDYYSAGATGGRGALASRRIYLQDLRMTVDP